MIQKRKRFQKRNSLVTNFSALVWILFFVLLISFLAVSNWKIQKRTSELKDQVKRLRGETESLEQKNQELKSGISQSEKESYIEGVARERLGLQKQGEEVVVVLPPEKKEDQNEKKGFWQKILDPVKNFFKNF